MTLPKPLSFVRWILAPCLVVALLAACSVLPQQHAVRTWRPVEGPLPAATPTAADFSLRVNRPGATGVLEQAGIVVLPAPGEVSTYQGARWSEPPALLVQRRLVDGFMQAGLPQVTTEGDHVHAQYTLGGHLRAFQAAYRGGGPVVVVRFDAQLRQGFSPNLLATRSFVVEQRPAGVAVPQVVAAFGKADDKLAARVVAWVVDEVQQASRMGGRTARSRRR